MFFLKKEKNSIVKGELSNRQLFLKMMKTLNNIPFSEAMKLITDLLPKAIKQTD